ncbi:MAG TPA: GPP34 family phosphoprotein [Anaerolineales bacterium]|nr:GPP34 family phosphoprotein [Anaerolineales bacterium]
MDTQPVIEPEVTPVAAPAAVSKPPAHSRPAAKKPAGLPIPEALFSLAIDDNDGIIAASLRNMLRYGLAAAFLAELGLANKIQMAEDRLTLAGTDPTGDALFDDILAMVAAEKKPRKLGRWIESIQSKLTLKQVALRLVERKGIVIEKKHYSWVIPFPAFPKVAASAKYSVKNHLRGIVLAGEPANPADIVLLSLLKACRMLRFVFTRDERKFADQKVAALVQNEVFGETVAKLLAEK